MNLISLDIRMLRSLAAIAETGSITETARRLGRTQPAITLQAQRLEELTGRTLFVNDGRRIRLTDDGALVLSYARSILRMHDELLSRLSAPAIGGHVVLGTPDLYAGFVLPPILGIFRSAFPGIQIELRCALSTPLVGMVRRGEVDVALVTRMNDFTGGRVVDHEQLVWATGEGSVAHEAVPVPLALLPPGNIFRDHAIDVLEQAGRPWRIVCISDSFSGLAAAVVSGTAVTVVGQAALTAGMRAIEVGPLFPALPRVELLLYRSSTATSPAAAALHDYLEHYLSLRSAGGAPAEQEAEAG
ncbi:MAG TPA: LysR substrate-binding domain-containing protein [Acetobacteraceae bacterium]|nr:LysR substrate-binding domain-containing protein [Acetobacteraceae bacterium]